MDYTKFFSKITNRRRYNLIRRLNDLYLSQPNCINFASGMNCLQRCNSDLRKGLAEWYVPQGGLFLWIKLIAVDNALDLVMNKFVPQGVFAVPGNAFNCDPSKPDHHLRFSFSYSSPEEMDKGLSIVAKIIREEVAKKNNDVAI